LIHVKQGEVALQQKMLGK